MRPPDMYDPGGSSSSRPHGKDELQPEVVLYTASASASRRRGRNSADRYALRALLRGYRLTVDERDVSTSKAHRCELKSLLAARGCAFSLPQLLVGGRLMGGPEQVRKLHEAGELQPLLDDAPRPSPAYICYACSSVNSMPCWTCRDSRNQKLDRGHADQINVTVEGEKFVLLDPLPGEVEDRCIEMEDQISASLGAMRPLCSKLDMMIGHQGCKLTQGVNTRLHLLKDDIEEISTYLEDLVEVEDPPLAAKCWMKEAHELSYGILDYIDNLMPLELLGCKSVHKMNHVKIPKRIKWQKKIEYTGKVSQCGIKPSCKTICVDVILVPRRLKWYQQMVEKVSELRTYAQQVIGRYERYDVHRCSTSTVGRLSPVGPMMPKPPCEETFNLVTNQWMSEFINSLAYNGDQQLNVVSIHGNECLGKTMLAKVLYNKVGRQFDCRAFIRVSRKPDMKRLFHDILSQIKRKQPQDDSDQLHVTPDNIRKHLHDKRYLIVVDDLWDTSSWDVINQLFPKGNQGSIIITTTQIEDVASACCCNHSEHVFEMKPLDDDHSRKLFFGRLFGSESDCPEEFKQVSSQIVEICGGLPLATISIASLLANHPPLSMDFFTHIHDSLISYLSSNSTPERTRQVLNLSYNSLPHYLKTCLLYVSMYPEGSIIFKRDMVMQWMAEGFIAAREGQDKEEVAGMYFDELVDRRFIHPMSVNYNNEVVSCTVHGVVHDLIAHKSAEENFIMVLDYNRKKMALSHKVHRLSLQLGDKKYAKIPSNIGKSQVRALAFFGIVECMPCISEFKLVRVLNLQVSSHHHGDQEPAIDLTGISELFHLRYLKIICDVCIRLPDRMRGLQCLETLDVIDTPRGTHVPWDIIYLPHLLHLCLPVDANLLDWSVSISGSLCKPNYLHNLYIYTPPYSDHPEINMGTLGSLIGGHGSLRSIQVVGQASSVRYGGPSRTAAEWDYLESPPHLQRFECSPHSRIIFFKIPMWMEGHGNLCILKISLMGLSIGDIVILRELPALMALSLYVDTAPDQKIIFKRVGFPVLRYFKLRFLSGIAWLEFEADAMPNLWKLKLIFNAIPRVGHQLYLYSKHPRRQYQHGRALISMEHMPGLREISIKFEGAAADLQYVSREGIVISHPSNPIIDVQRVDSGSHGDKGYHQGHRSESSSHLHVPVVEGGPGSGREHQEGVSWNDTIDVIGRELFIYSLHRLSRWDYGAIAFLNRDFNSVVRNGDIYRLRRKNGVLEHCLYLSCYQQEWHAYDPSNGRWLHVPKMMPAEGHMWESHSLAVGTELLVFGNASVSFRYSILTNSWTYLADKMNTSRWLFGSASAGGKAYVAGGFDSSTRRALSSAEMYDSGAHVWKPLPSMNRARYKCSGVFMDGKFYVLGGFTNNWQLLTCGEEYDLQRMSWRVIENMSEGLNTDAIYDAPPLIAVVNNELYAADYSKNDFKQYDKQENKWITHGKLPVKSASMVIGSDIHLLACGDRLIVVGPPTNYVTGTVELHSWIANEQPPVWNLIATRPSSNRVMCTVMSC